MGAARASEVQYGGAMARLLDRSSPAALSHPGLRLGALLLAAFAGCAPPADEEPVVERYDTLAEAERLAEQSWDRWDPADLSFDWSQAVLAWGIQRAFDASGTPRHQDYYRTWLDAGLAERFDAPDAQPFRSSDSMSPSILASLATAEGAGDYAPILGAAEEYLAGARRTDEGGAIVHWGPEHPFGGPRQVWIDSMFMIGMYLLAEGDRTGEAMYADRWVTQADGTRLHCMTADDLYLHAWDDDDGLNIPVEPVYWARGNSWVLVSAAEAVARGVDWQEGYVAHARALVDAQQPSGRWLTVLDGPPQDGLNYEETSATALIAYGLSVGLEAGALDRAEFGPALDRAVQGILERVVVEEDGHHTVMGTSLGTNPGGYDNYVSIATLPDQLVGVGAVIALLAQVQGTEISR